MAYDISLVIAQGVHPDEHHLGLIEVIWLVVLNIFPSIWDGLVD